MYFYWIQIIQIRLYGFKYFYWTEIVQIRLYVQVFLLNANNADSFVFKYILFNTNNINMFIWFKVILWTIKIQIDSYGFKYFYWILIIQIGLYVFKYFLFNTNNINTFIWFQVFVNTNNTDRESIGVHLWWVRPCFSCSVLRVWFI